MASIRDLPEVQSLDQRDGFVRIPPEIDVPLTPRVRQLIDTAEFRRLAHVSQVGLVSLVYPAANHSRFEHSLGVFRLALLYLKQLSYDPRFATQIQVADAERFLVAALLHDLGHWPYCHPIEDMGLARVPHHEMFANSFLLEGELAEALRTAWNMNPRDVVSLLSEKPSDPRSSILGSMLSGPIDIDKLDYLGRDSLHAGVPYGRHFDQGRLIGSLCLNAAGTGLAITEKGKTAAEMMVFARYVMFSEVYWHHAVRTATAMLQRAFYLLHEQLDLDSLFRLTEFEFIAELTRLAANQPAGELLDGLFGPTRRLYKRVAQYSFFEACEVYDAIARRGYPWLVRCGEQFAKLATRAVGHEIAPHEILFDAPPVEREVEFDLSVYFPKEDCYRPLGDVSPVVRTLAREQFDDYVKRVRLFAHPRVAADLQALGDLSAMMLAAAGQTK